MYFYKYTDFFIENYNLLTGSDKALKHIVLPIGISFFTFQLIAFLVDCYRTEMRQYDFVNYLLFITFFPQLIVGPIIHHSEVVPQFENEANLKLSTDHIALGLFLFSIGCAKKTLLADPMTTDAEKFFNSVSANSNLLYSWFSSLEYTVSYYFDLSGYADMAIGLGWMFNISIPHNFDSPYKARNFQDYWRRWHMTLSRFLSSYIFRSVYNRDIAWRNYYVATMVTFLVSGFWHGAGWTFVVWGIVNGMLVCIASWMKRANMSLPAWVAYPLTVLIIMTVVNAINLIDGIDGLASGISIIILAVYVYLFMDLGSIVFVVISASLLGAVIVFFCYNVFGRIGGMKIFMGDAGSLVLGYVLAYLGIKFVMISGQEDYNVINPLLIPFSLLMVPVFDLIRVALLRLAAGEPMFHADQRHIHHMLMRCGLSMHQALFTILLLVIGFLLLNLVLDSVLVPMTVIFFFDVAFFLLFYVVCTSIIQIRDSSLADS